MEWHRCFGHFDFNNGLLRRPCQCVVRWTTVNRSAAAKKDDMGEQLPHLRPWLMNRHHQSYLRKMTSQRRQTSFKIVETTGNVSGEGGGTMLV